MTDAATLSPVHNPDMNAFLNGEQEINGVSYADLVARHGADNVNNALFNLFNEIYADDVRDQVAGTPLEDDYIEFLDEQLGIAQQPTTPEAQDDVDDAYRDLMKFYAEERAEEIEADAEAAPGEGAGASKEPGAGGAGGGMGNHWLVVLAKAMGGAAGEHLKQSVILGNEIAAISGRPDQDGSTPEGSAANAQKAKDMAEAQAKLQAHTQMFKMAFEASSTFLKTMGEGMSTMARKQ